jgi:hypothetical protein
MTELEIIEDNKIKKEQDMQEMLFSNSKLYLNFKGKFPLNLSTKGNGRKIQL